MYYFDANVFILPQIYDESIDEVKKAKKDWEASTLKQALENSQERKKEFLTTSSVPLTVVVGTNSISFSSGTNLNLSTWHYWTWQEDGVWKINVSEPSWNWQKEKPNQ